jgi:aldehyde dehydrogenase (NAD+)
MSAFTSPEQFEESYTTLFKTFDTGKTRNLAWRKWQLKQCWWMIVDNEAEIIKALKDDLNRPQFEAYATDIRGMKEDILFHIEHLEEWAADDIPDAGFILGTLSKARVRKEPLGVALIIGAWNFPFVLNLCPLYSAIAAGCCAMVKPSELTPVSQNLLAELVPKYLDSDAIRVVTGGPKETSSMLERKYNQIFFTGSNKIAGNVVAAAAKHLTPVVLELGGQGPAIVTNTADVELAAKRVALGKHVNAGQICLSPNHTFVHPDIHDKFVERLGYWSEQFLDGSTDSITHIVNERNFDRLSGLLDKTNGKVIYGGKKDRENKFFSPTIVTGVKTSGKSFLIFINHLTC